MYLTRHGNGYRFQRRIPAELVPILGKSPIRLNLGRIPSRTAAAASRLLAGHLDRLFLCVLKRGPEMQQHTDPRDAIIAELQARLADLVETSREAAERADEVIALQQRAHAAELEEQKNRLRVEALQRENHIRVEINEVYASSIETRANVLAALTLKRSVQKQVSEQVVAPSLDSLSQRLESLSVAVESVLEGGAPGPLMSEALEWWHHEIRLPLGLSGSKTDTDYNRRRCRSRPRDATRAGLPERLRPGWKASPATTNKIMARARSRPAPSAAPGARKGFRMCRGNAPNEPYRSSIVQNFARLLRAVTQRSPRKSAARVFRYWTATRGRSLSRRPVHSWQRPIAPPA